MGGKSCFFIGHREASEEIYPVLYAAVEQHIVEYGVTEFIVGHYGGFDRLAASAVKEAKRFYPEVKLATVYKGNIIKNLIMDCQSYTKYRPNETTGGIFVSWRRKEELPTGA